MDTSDSTPPRLGASVNKRLARLSPERLAAASTSKLTMSPPPCICSRANAYCGWLFRNGSARAAPWRCSDKNSATAARSHSAGPREPQRLHSAHQHPRGMRIHAIAQRRPLSQICRSIPGRPPPRRRSGSECPPRYFVPECIDETIRELRRTLIDRRAEVESVMLINLFCFASSATFLKSTTRNVGLVGDSR